MPITVQQDATTYSLFMSVNRSTRFEWYLQPSSGAHVTLCTAHGISKIVTAMNVIHGKCTHGFTNAICCAYSDMSS